MLTHAKVPESGPRIRTCLVQTGAKSSPDSDIAPLKNQATRSAKEAKGSTRFAKSAQRCKKRNQGKCVKTHLKRLGTKWNQVGTKWPEAVKVRTVHAVCELYETM